MKSLSQLTDFYYRSLYPTLEELEVKRKNARFKVLLFAVVIILLDLMSLSLFEKNLDLLLLANAAAGAFVYKFLTHDYTQEFKDRVIEPLIHEIDKNLIYDKDKHIQKYQFINSALFASLPDKIDGNDYISGILDGVKIELSDVHAQKKHQNHRGRDSWVTVFRGLFIVSEFNKNFRSRTLVLPDNAQKSFGGLIGNWLQSHNINRDELVKMDNPEFEKEFVVYGSDQIEARYILNHTLMRRLLDFKRKTKHNIYISFLYSNIYIAIDYNRDLFEPSLFRSLLDFKVVLEYARTLSLAIGVVEELKLNQKIWSKE